MENTKLHGMKKGLIKLIHYSKTEELALILSSKVGEKLKIPNNVFCYRAFITEYLRNKNTYNNPNSFHATTVMDEQIIKINNRIILLNYKYPCLTKTIKHEGFYASCAIDEIFQTLTIEGFGAESGDKLRDYMNWEKYRLKMFKQ